MACLQNKPQYSSQLDFFSKFKLLQLDYREKIRCCYTGPPQISKLLFGYEFKYCEMKNDLRGRTERLCPQIYSRVTQIINAKCLYLKYRMPYGQFRTQSDVQYVENINRNFTFLIFFVHLLSWLWYFLF